MSIQDCIFDVEAKLEGTPEAEQFDRIIRYLGGLESQLETYRNVAAKYGELLTSLEKYNMFEQSQKTFKDS